MRTDLAASSALNRAFRGAAILSRWSCKPLPALVSAVALVAGVALFPLGAGAQDARGDDGGSRPAGTDPVVEHVEGSSEEMPPSLRRRLSPREQARPRKHRATSEKS
jgi:hypothetical protein